MDISVVVLAWKVADLQAAATLVSLPAANQHGGCTAQWLVSRSLVSPGAVTDDIALFTSKSDDLFTHRHHSHPLALRLIVCPVFL